MEATGWFRVRAALFDADATTATDLVADALWQHDPPAVEERPVDGGTELVAGYPARSTAEAAAAAARAAGARAVDVAPVDDDGLDGWRAHARPHRAGPFVVVPPWLPAPVDPEQRVLVVDPGRAFGSGSHPTTRLVLAELADVVTPGTSVLDVGCGSGVLAVGAALLGADPVHAIDIDASAPTATLANAAANGVADRITTSTEPLEELAAADRSYDVVLANLLAPVIVDLAPALATVVAPRGTLVLSGLLADRWRPATDAVAAGGGPAGLIVDGVVEEDGWVAVRMRRGAAGAATGTLPGHGRHAGGGDPVR